MTKISESALESLWRQRQQELPSATGLAEYTNAVLRELKRHSHPNYLHSLRVSLLADELAQAEGLEDSKPAFYGGALHDAGKLRIPREVLEGEAINNSDFKEIKRHAELGYEMMNAKHPICAMIAASHHRIGRSGYGLKPEEAMKRYSLEGKPDLKFCAQAVGLADYYDAAMSRRTASVDGTQLKEEMEHAFHKQLKLVPKLFASKYAHLFYGQGKKS